MLRLCAFLTAALIGFSTLAVPAFAFEGGKGGRGKGKGRARMNPEERFKKLDTDNNSKLSLDEFKVGKPDATRAEARFKKIDVNNDGFVSLDELKTAAAHEKERKKKA